MDGDFAVSRPLVRPGLPRIRFLFVGSRLRSALPSDPASRRRPCASLALHLHQVVQGTCTPKLSNMLGTQLKPLRGRLGRAPVHTSISRDCFWLRDSRLGSPAALRPMSVLNCILEGHDSRFGVELV